MIAISYGRASMREDGVLPEREDEARKFTGVPVPPVSAADPLAWCAGLSEKARRAGKG